MEENKASAGVQAYRWMVAGGIAIIAVLSMKQLERIEKAADGVATLQTLMSSINARVDGHGERLTGHDRKIERLEDKVLRSPN